ncbi:efflux pump antibiotic resistance [Colletotrichum truncatum]|uniref:Efflux pump antibiotic resistance n=1 Tax=Colletotrichum truncatum TaxID=5467 RepID=A0ACC3YVQ0_COLTU|nr:efflux pump antibiotic resistance [Colletotrichum truncatum]KAF6791299.1 efflux pump antibiotic resistance [Colletotrichum truncatum]
MAPQFHPAHILPLLFATTFTIGGALPLWNPTRAILEFGLPEHIANTKEAHSPFAVYGSRMTAWGIAMWSFYLRGNIKALDTMLAVLFYMGIADGYVCYMEGVPGRALFRFLASAVLSGWGFLGLTSRLSRA